jgi:RNA binding exosome subunit
MVKIKIFHSVIASVFIKENEDAETINKALVSLFPFDLEENKLKVEETIASTFFNKKIRITEVKLTKKKLVNCFMEKLKQNISDADKEMVLRQLYTRVDDEGNFFIRLSKKRLLEGKHVVVDHGDCFHVKCHIAAYPQNKENAMKIVREFFG